MLYCLLALDLLHLTSFSLVDYVENLANDLQNPIMPASNKEEMHKTHETLLRSPAYYHTEATMVKYCGYWTFVAPTHLSILPIRLKNEAKFSADSGLDTPHVDTNIDSLGFSWLVSSMKRHLIAFQCSDCFFMSAENGIYDMGELSRETRHQPRYRPPREFE